MNDDQLGDLLSVTRGTLQINHAYGSGYNSRVMKPKWKFDSEANAFVFNENQRSDN